MFLGFFLSSRGTGVAAACKSQLLHACANLSGMKNYHLVLVVGTWKKEGLQGAARERTRIIQARSSRRRCDAKRFVYRTLPLSFFVRATDGALIALFVFFLREKKKHKKVSFLLLFLFLVSSSSSHLPLPLSLTFATAPRVPPPQPPPPRCPSTSWPPRAAPRASPRWYR